MGCTSAIGRYDRCNGTAGGRAVRILLCPPPFVFYSAELRGLTLKQLAWDSVNQESKLDEYARIKRETEEKSMQILASIEELRETREEADNAKRCSMYMMAPRLQHGSALGSYTVTREFDYFRRLTAVPTATSRAALQKPLPLAPLR